MSEPQPPRVETDEAELDRLVARSLAASERGSRAATAAPAGKGGGRWGWIAAGGLGLLLLGMVASPMVERQVRSRLPDAVSGPEAGEGAEAANAERLSAAEQRLDRLELRATRLAEQLTLLGTQPPLPPPADPAPTGVPSADPARLATIEAALARLAEGDAAQSARMDRLVADLIGSGSGFEQQRRVLGDLLVLTTIRRLFDQGRSLGAVLPLLAERASLVEPEMVAALSTWSATPVTRAALLNRLDLAETEAAPPPAGLWQRLVASVSGLVVVRDADGSDLARQSARDALAGGDLGAAMQALEAAPAGPVRTAWLADARRQLEAETALLALEQRLLVMLSDAVRAQATAPAALVAEPPRAGTAAG